jgi:hypothetical protein
VAKLLECSYKTVQRALKVDGIVKGKWVVKPIGKAHLISPGKQGKFENK